MEQQVQVVRSEQDRPVQLFVSIAGWATWGFVVKKSGESQFKINLVVLYVSVAHEVKIRNYLQLFNVPSIDNVVEMLVDELDNLNQVIVLVIGDRTQVVQQINAQPVKLLSVLVDKGVGHVKRFDILQHGVQIVFQFLLTVPQVDPLPIIFSQVV